MFDTFRLERCEREVALDLVRRDIIGARVEAEVTEPAGQQGHHDCRCTAASRRREGECA